MFINGKWTEAESGRSFQSTNPATGDSIGQVPAGDGVDAIKAIDAAAAAFPGWSSQTAYQRSQFLYTSHTLMMENLERLAAIMTQEQGKPIQASRNEVKYGADFLLWYSEEAKRIYGQTIPSARAVFEVFEKAGNPCRRRQSGDSSGTGADRRGFSG